MNAFIRSPAIDQYVIYDHPADDPEHVVMRRWAILPGRAIPMESTAADSIEEARALIARKAPDAVRFATDPHDDPCIVEVWL